MKGLLLRLSALDADAATAVRVIAHFEALLGARPGPASLTRSTAGLAGCAAGLVLPDGRTARFGPDGAALPGPPERVSGRVELEPDGRVWLERPGPPGPFDELVLEWMAVTARVLAGRPHGTGTPRAADPALVELVLSAREDAPDRTRALRLLGLAAGLPLRVAAVSGGPGTDADVAAVALLGRGAVRGTVRVARVGPLGAVLLQRPDDPGHASPAPELRAALDARLGDHGTGRGSAHALRAGVGGAADPLDARTSWAQARAALRFAVPGGPEEAVADHDELGPVALLADIPAERLGAQPDVRRLREVAGGGHGGELLGALAAFCRTGSLRQAAAALHLHHSSVAARLSRVEEALGWRLRDPQDRFRAQLALYALRLSSDPGPGSGSGGGSGGGSGPGPGGG
ncbi:helix-turn-helix domain-containing protein [Streptomyces sp. TRM 70351]|uniref:PucR family transcriptional regulator n=1 Tax=Streptomyces sp. TRM 70351 TaxID=3116552 RepID=UPI002E7C4FA5|nr:helix-turn-helix domain-containing protein [Streptomyces sp. TRM 70351]MEE1930099.1 helix-turn-helix domain-containing protein [Streptomyces sp. TRM 70351]